MKKVLSTILALVLVLSTIFTLPKVQASSVPVGAGRVNTVSTSLNVRSSPSSTSNIKTTLKRNTFVTLISKSGSYWYVRYADNSFGYCHTDYIYQVSSKVRKVKTTSGKLRVRSGASTQHSIKDYLPSGEIVIIHTLSGDFAKIIYKGNKVGFVHKNYLVTFTANEPTNYKTISLQVPDYKQTDSRWANVTLGSSGQSIGKIGCATTALAMTESFRTNTTIYPHQMSKKLSYTSGGAVYWPTNYEIITSSSGYLKKIYTALQNGKPVIVGAKKANGAQHYVVVKKVIGGNTLSTSSFYINDPGSNSRTTLAEFFSVYPYFYKMLYAK